MSNSALNNINPIVNSILLEKTSLIANKFVYDDLNGEICIQRFGASPLSIYNEFIIYEQKFDYCGYNFSKLIDMERFVDSVVIFSNHKILFTPIDFKAINAVQFKEKILTEDSVYIQSFGAEDVINTMIDMEIPYIKEYEPFTPDTFENYQTSLKKEYDEYMEKNNKYYGEYIIYYINKKYPMLNKQLKIIRVPDAFYCQLLLKKI